jgi:hypothetical protein
MLNPTESGTGESSTALADAAAAAGGSLRRVRRALDTSIAEYVDDHELERRTPIKRPTWQKMRRGPKGGGPPYSKVGNRVLYSWEAVRGWIEARRVA